MQDHWLVIGGGFKGVISSFLLSSKGKQVTLIEAGNSIGGVIASVPWKDFVLDKGCHLFSNENDKTTSVIMDILDEEYEPVQVQYASVVNGIKTDGIAIPDFESYGKHVSEKILIELLHTLTGPVSENKSLDKNLENRFGPTAGNYLDPAVKKFSQIPAAELDACSLGMTPFQRIKFLDDNISTLLKKIPELDDRIAVPSQTDPMKYYRDSAKKYEFRNYYPTDKGLLKFCNKAEQKLMQNGVNICLESPISKLEFNKDCEVVLKNGDRIIGSNILWATDIQYLDEFTDIDINIGKYIHQVPMVVYYFIIDKQYEGQYTYLQNYDENDHVFRASVPGSYIKKSACPDGKSYICCEVPTNLDSPIWKNKDAFVENVWEEIQKYQVVRECRPLDVISINIPVTYKLPRVGYQDAMDEIITFFRNEPRFTGYEDWEFSKNNIIKKMINICN